MQKWEWQCLADEFQCESGACIPWESMCNGSDDCLIYGLESEDEQWETCDQVMPVNSLYLSFYTHYPYPLSLSIIPIHYPCELVQMPIFSNFPMYCNIYSRQSTFNIFQFKCIYFDKSFSFNHLYTAL